MNLDAIWNHDHEYYGTISRITPRDGYVIYTNPSLTNRYDPNHAGLFRLREDQVQSALEDIEHFFYSLDMDAVVYLDANATPASLDGALQTAGFVKKSDWGSSDLMIQHAEIPAIDPSIRIDVALSHDDFVRWCSVNQPDPYSPDDLMHKLHYQTVSAPGVNGYMAIVDDRPVARCVTYINHGLGRVESVFVEEAYRRRGIAHALVGRALHDIAAHGATGFLFAVHEEPALALYHKLGLRTVLTEAVYPYVKPYAEM
jgi:ribosomal protein S18 acetylase RimI-like enzyme